MPYLMIPHYDWFIKMAQICCRTHIQVSTCHEFWVPGGEQGGGGADVRYNKTTMTSLCGATNMLLKYCSAQVIISSFNLS